MAISGIGSYNASSIAGSRHWSKASPADILADVRELTNDGESQSSKIKSYDFTSMTPKEMRGLADQLFHEGKIDLTQSFMLQRMGIPLGKIGSQGEFIPLSPEELTNFENTPVDYFAVGTGAVESLEQMGKATDPQYGYQNWKNILSVLDELQGSPKGIDLTA